MNRTTKSICGVLAFFYAVAVAAAGSANEAENRLEAELEKGLTKGLPSISMAIATRQGAVWTGSVGLANVVSQSRSHAGYLYGIGSITKMFVACVVEQLIDEGRLTPTARVRDVLGEEVIQAIPNADRATVGQLLDHTSGVPSWEFDPLWIRRGRGAEIDVEHVWSKTEALDYLRSGRDKAAHEPGAGYTYSNTNYTLLGLIIEKVTGQAAVSEIHRRLLDSRGMTDVKFEGFETVDEARLPARYQFGTAEFSRVAGVSPAFRDVGHGLLDVSRSNLSTEWTAGGIVATPHDLALFARDLRDGRVVSAEALARMESFRPSDDPDEEMGQGLARDHYGKEVLIGYSGNVLGFGSVVGWAPNGDLVIALSTNVGAMHAGESAYYLEKLLKETQIIARARELAVALAPRSRHQPP